LPASPPNARGELLFDDIVHLPNMQDEHDIFINVLKAFLGKENVLEVRDLLAESTRDEESKYEVINKITDFEELPYSFIPRLPAFRRTIGRHAHHRLPRTGRPYPLRPHPQPDLYPRYRRDGQRLRLITKANKTARFRENFLTRLIFSSHPVFRRLKADGKTINLNRVDKFPPSKKGETISIEGGDVMMLNKDYLLIGCSERTNNYAFQLIKNTFSTGASSKTWCRSTSPPSAPTCTLTRYLPRSTTTTWWATSPSCRTASAPSWTYTAPPEKKSNTPA
jgi:arginine deiminase